jgi:hypothetical protein
VLEPSAVSRPVYLPASHWIDYWTGVPAEGYRTIEVAAPLKRLPTYVRASAIIPTYPDDLTTVRVAHSGWYCDQTARELWAGVGPEELSDGPSGWLTAGAVQAGGRKEYVI